MNLLRFRSVTRDVRLELPDGSSRLVKVTTNELGTGQQVEDGDALHGTARPVSIAVQVRQPSRQRRGALLKNLGMPRARQAFAHDFDTGLWAPVPGTLERKGSE